MPRCVVVGRKRYVRLGGEAADFFVFVLSNRVAVDFRRCAGQSILRGRVFFLPGGGYFG